jgi:Na+/citrate or Na+/malate symporter
MNLEIFAYLLSMSKQKITGKKPRNDKIGKVVELFVFMVLLIVIILAILYENIINKLLVVFFVVFLMFILLKKVKLYVSTEQKSAGKDVIFIYCGAALILISVLFFSSWVVYCEITDYTVYCKYPTYVLCCEVALIFFLVVYFLKKE